MQPSHRTRCAICLCVALVLATPAAPSAAATDTGNRAYDAQLMRLSEILGALHYLRELCDGSDGQRWRNAVDALIKSEGDTALRRATIARRFNVGYRGYRRTYRNCTASARTTIDRFFKEASEISDALIKLAE